MTRCECCTHPLEHAIKEALDGIANETRPAPVIANLRAALEQWQEEEYGAKPDLDFCSRCHEHADFEMLDGRWVSTCCGSLAISPDVND